MTTPESRYVIPGHNKATYGPIPQVDQIFSVELLEVGPLPIPVDRIFFTLLRGYIPQSKAQSLGVDDATLSKATFTVSSSVVYPDGQPGETRTSTIPLRTFATAMAHLAIRNSTGAHVDYLSMGKNDIVADFWIPGMWIETGNWAFEFIAKLPDETCLFALTFTQWLEGKQERVPPPNGEKIDESIIGDDVLPNNGKEKDKKKMQ